MKKVLIAVAIVIAVLLGVFAFFGGFAIADVRLQEQNGSVLVGKNHTGAYKNIGGVFDEVEKIKESSTLSSSIYVGIYFDDPKTVAEKDLKSFAGFTVPNKEIAIELCKKHPGCTFQEIPKGSSYICDLKTTKSSLSMMIAAMKAYPALGDAAAGLGEGKKVTHMYEMYMDGFTRFVMQFE